MKKILRNIKPDIRFFIISSDNLLKICKNDGSLLLSLNTPIFRGDEFSKEKLMRCISIQIGLEGGINIKISDSFSQNSFEKVDFSSDDFIKLNFSQVYSYDNLKKIQDNAISDENYILAGKIRDELKRMDSVLDS